MRIRFSSLILLLALPSIPVLCSPGDSLDEFEECTQACEHKVCQHDNIGKSNPFLGLPFNDVSNGLKLLLWDCESNCDYQCQQIITEIRIFADEEVLQFHGKWPFKRILLVQEFASSFFSILNFIPHYMNFKKTVKKYRYAQHPNLKVLYQNVLIIEVIAMLAWISSTIFHLRDLIITERFDYFFAGATVLSGFHALLIRVFRFDLNPQRKKIASYSCLVLYLYHFLRLCYDWSYTYNMQANVTVALLQYSLFLVLAYQHYKKTPKNRFLYLTPIFLILSVVFGMSFEIFDFINLKYQIDAHAIWHLTTIIPSFYLYEFLYRDIESLQEKYLD